jgi:hypothetical protein
MSFTSFGSGSKKFGGSVIELSVGYDAATAAHTRARNTLFIVAGHLWDTRRKFLLF